MLRLHRSRRRTGTPENAASTVARVRPLVLRPGRTVRLLAHRGERVQRRLRSLRRPPRPARYAPPIRVRRGVVLATGDYSSNAALRAPVSARCHPPAGRKVLPGQMFVPAQRLQHRPDQSAFSVGFVWLAGMGEARKDTGQPIAQFGWINARILRTAANPFDKVILGKQSTGGKQRWISHPAGLTRPSAAAKIFRNQLATWLLIALRAPSIGRPSKAQVQQVASCCTDWLAPVATASENAGIQATACNTQCSGASPLFDILCSKINEIDGSGGGIYRTTLSHCINVILLILSPEIPPAIPPLLVLLRWGAPPMRPTGLRAKPRPETCI